MAIQLYYRIADKHDELPILIDTTNYTEEDFDALDDKGVVINAPLSMLQIDANMFAISAGFHQVDKTIANVNQQLDTKASSTNPTFNGTITLPHVTNVTNVGSPVKGMIVFDESAGSLKYYDGSEWRAIANDVGLADYVKVKEPRLLGYLNSNSGGEFNGPVKVAQVDLTTGQSTETIGFAATTDWVLDAIDQRFGGDSTDGLTLNNSNLTINNGDIIMNGGKYQGDLDMGTL